MENFIIETAKRQQAKLRLGLAAPSGGGKTYSALQLAYGMTGDWTKIGVIDTEEYSSNLYAHLGGFKTINFKPPYTPERYLAAIHAFEMAGMDVIIIDSVTHVWKGEGGLLESNQALGGKFADWAKTTPRYQRFLQGILGSKSHVITTVRKKTAYSMTMEGGKTKVEKQGLDDEIRDGFEYELTSAFNININHLAEASKDRTGLFMKADGSNVGFVITPETGKMLREWAEGGSPVPKPASVPAPVTVPTIAYINEESKKKIYALAAALGKSKEEAETIIVNHFKLSDFADTTERQAQGFIQALQKKIALKEQEEQQRLEMTEDVNPDDIPDDFGKDLGVQPKPVSKMKGKK